MTNTATLLDHLLEHGPCSEQELHAHLVALGRTKAKTPSGMRSTLQSCSLAARLPDGRWDSLARRLTGTVLTVRPRSRLRDGVLWVHGDVEPLCSAAVGSRSRPAASPGSPATSAPSSGRRAGSRSPPTCWP